MADTIEVTGSGAASGTPDQVVLDLRIQAERDTVADSLRAVSEGVRAVVERTATYRVAASVPPPRTLGLNLHARHDHEGRGVIGYSASQQVRLCLPGTDLASEVITTVSEAAGDTLGIDGLSLSVSDPAGLQRSAREAAFADARGRAEQFAHLAGRELGMVREVRDGPGHGGGPVPQLARAAAFDASSMPIEAGEHSVTATVTVTWDLV